MNIRVYPKHKTLSTVRTVSTKNKIISIGYSIVFQNAIHKLSLLPAHTPFQKFVLLCNSNYNIRRIKLAPATRSVLSSDWDLT